MTMSMGFLVDEGTPSLARTVGCRTHSKLRDVLGVNGRAGHRHATGTGRALTMPSRCPSGAITYRLRRTCADDAPGLNMFASRCAGARHHRERSFSLP